jgi:hypothetical protein
MRARPIQFRLVSGLALGVMLLARPSGAAPITINFDNLADSDVISTQYTGLTFSNAMALTAGISLNEFDFPPRSGFNVASDSGGPMRIDFGTLVSGVGGYFTYSESLVLSAFGAGGVLLGSVPSAFSANSVSSGGAPNEFLQLAFNDIAYVTFSGNPLGGSFALDDLTYSPAQTSPVPEPGTLSLVLMSGAGWLGARRAAKRYRRSQSTVPTPRD